MHRSNHIADNLQFLRMVCHIRQITAIRRLCWLVSLEPQYGFRFAEFKVRFAECLVNCGYMRSAAATERPSLIRML